MTDTRCGDCHIELDDHGTTCGTRASQDSRDDIPAAADWWMCRWCATVSGDVVLYAAMPTCPVCMVARHRHWEHAGPIVAFDRARYRLSHGYDEIDPADPRWAADLAELPTDGTPVIELGGFVYWINSHGSPVPGDGSLDCVHVDGDGVLDISTVSEVAWHLIDADFADLDTAVHARLRDHAWTA